MIAASMSPSTQWQQGRQHELAFWSRYFSTQGWLWPEDFAQSLNPDQPLQGYVIDCLQHLELEFMSILDVGAGPLTRLGKTWPGHHVHITAVDPLATEYRAFVRANGLAPLVETQCGDAEHLADQFEPDTFDLVHCLNALDHSYDPMSGILQMLHVARPGSFVVLEHGANEAVRQNYEGMHQWNFCNDNGNFIIWNQAHRINVNQVVAEQADVFLPPMADPSEWIQVRLRKKTA